LDNLAATRGIFGSEQLIWKSIDVKPVFVKVDDCQCDVKEKAGGDDGWMEEDK
jgi:hypothetical protein